jgi:hypothetical protein
VEAFYCRLIEKATHATYGREPSHTYAWVENLDEGLLPQIPHLKLVKSVGLREAILDVPRYQEFTGVASVLAQHGVRFLEIAGNSEITVSALAPEAWRYQGSVARPLFFMPIRTRPGWQRVVPACGASSLDRYRRARGLVSGFRARI